MATTGIVDKNYLERQFKNFWEQTRSVGANRIIDGSVTTKKFADTVPKVAKTGSYKDLSDFPVTFEITGTSLKISDGTHTWTLTADS